jgi:hypothetical protein
MQSLLYGVAVLACPVGMGVMMWMMMRGQRHRPDDASAEQHLAALRAKIGILKADRARQPTSGLS